MRGHSAAVVGALLALLAAHGQFAVAQDIGATVLDVPLSEAQARVVDGSLRVIVVGTPDPRVMRLSAQRLSSRRRGEARGRAVIHHFVDQALSRAQTAASSAARAHAAVDAHASVVGRRPLAAGGTVVVVELEMSRLRQAAPEVSWTD
jgi:hypothetical protein